MEKGAKKLVANNKKVYHEYFLEEIYEAGIALHGTEVKSIRNNNTNINDAFVIIRNNEAYIINMYIAKYDEGNRFNHDERCERKLLLNKKEHVKH